MHFFRSLYRSFRRMRDFRCTVFCRACWSAVPHKNEGTSLDRATWQQNIGLYTDMPKKPGNWTHHSLQVQCVSCNFLIYIIINRLWLSAAQGSAFAQCGQSLHDQGPLPSLRQWPTQLLFASWLCRVCNVSQNQNHYQADY